MSQLDDLVTAAAADELSVLKARADMMNVSYHPSIGVDKLREKVTAALTAKTPEDAVKLSIDSEASERDRLLKDASKLVRIRISCMNPAKKEWAGEIFSVGNSVVGTFKKFVPFNSDEGWHVPHIIYEQLVARECQVFVTVRDGRGNQHRKGKIIKEFAVEVMTALTGVELEELARRQAMANSID